MKLEILSVSDCPNVATLIERVRCAIAGRDDVPVTRTIVRDEAGAEAHHMPGSPTLLVDGVDPFVQPGQKPSLSCRIFVREDGGRAGAPSLAQIRLAIGRRQIAA